MGRCRLHEFLDQLFSRKSKFNEHGSPAARSLAPLKQDTDQRPNILGDITRYSGSSDYIAKVVLQVLHMKIDDVTFIEKFVKIHRCHETVRNSSFGTKSYAESTPKSLLDIEPNEYP